MKWMLFGVNGFQVTVSRAVLVLVSILLQGTWLRSRRPPWSVEIMRGEEEDCLYGRLRSKNVVS